jgi:hypothetical protein
MARGAMMWEEVLRDFWRLHNSEEFYEEDEGEDKDYVA